MGLHIPADSQIYGGIHLKELYAHSANSQGQRHRLDDHLKGTAERAANMAKEFGCSRWGWLAGLWHDVGVCRKKPCIFPPQKRQ